MPTPNAYFKVCAENDRLKADRDALLAAAQLGHAELRRFLNANFTDQVQQHTDDDTIAAEAALRFAIEACEKGQP